MKSMCQKCKKVMNGHVVSKPGTYKILGETVHGPKYHFVCDKCGTINVETIETLEMNSREAIKAFREKFNLVGEGSITLEERSLLKEKYGIPKKKK